MAKTKTAPAKKRAASKDNDSAFVLKLVLYALAGSMWIKLQTGNVTVPLPVGVLIGLQFAGHEHFQINRKIEYAVLVLAALVGLIAPFGLFLDF